MYKAGRQPNGGENRACQGSRLGTVLCTARADDAGRRRFAGAAPAETAYLLRGVGEELLEARALLGLARRCVFPRDRGLVGAALALRGPGERRRAVGLAVAVGTAAGAAIGRRDRNAMDLEQAQVVD